MLVHPARHELLGLPLLSDRVRGTEMATAQRNVTEMAGILRNFWSAYLRTRSKPPFVHPDDENYFNSIDYWRKHPYSRQKLTFQQYIRSHRFADLKNSD